MRRVFGVLSLTLAFVLVAGEAQALTPVKVIVEPANQFFPASDGEYIAFTTNSTDRPNRVSARVERLSNGVGWRMNAAGTEGFSGGVDPSSDKVIFQQVRFKDYVSNLYYWDIGARRRTKVPDVNTDWWEWDPLISATFITFFRDYRAGGTWYTGVFLYRRSNGAIKRIATARIARGAFLLNGSVGDRYATWSRCTKATCVAYVYDRETGKVARIPTKNGRPQYGSVIDEGTGRIFYTRSGFGCGLDVKILEIPVDHLGADPAKIVDLPDGIDLSKTSLAPNLDSGGQDLLFDRVVCAKYSWDIYAVRNVVPPQP